MKFNRKLSNLWCFSVFFSVVFLCQCFFFVFFSCSRGNRRNIKLARTHLYIQSYSTNEIGDMIFVILYLIRVYACDIWSDWAPTEGARGGEPYWVCWTELFGLSVHVLLVRVLFYWTIHITAPVNLSFYTKKKSQSTNPWAWRENNNKKL